MDSKYALYLLFYCYILTVLGLTFFFVSYRLIGWYVTRKNLHEVERKMRDTEGKKNSNIHTSELSLVIFHVLLLTVSCNVF